jgi:phosphoheptose isomerase
LPKQPCDLLFSFRQTFSSDETHQIIEHYSNCLASLIADSYNNGKLVCICGNGGSCADAQHFSSELVCTYRSKLRPPIPALALTTDTSILTAWSNDFSYQTVFSRQIEAYRQNLGLLIALSTSGRSANICEALKSSFHHDIPSVLITGTHDYDLPAIASLNIILPSSDTPIIQLLTSYLYHATCEILEATIS